MKKPIYKISARGNFFEKLALGIINKDKLTCKLKNNIVILPTQIACNHFIEAFKKVTNSNNFPIVLPISDLSYLFPNENKVFFERVSVTGQVTKYILDLKIPEFSNFTGATILAEYFIDFFLQLNVFEVDINNFKKIILEDLAVHKQKISIILENTLDYINEIYSQNKAAYNNKLIKNLLTKTSNKNVIIAGINSNISAIRELIKESINFFNVDLILYGVDDNIPENIWETLKKNHYQYNIKCILENLGYIRKDIKPWFEDDKEMHDEFLSTAFLPFQYCHDWHKISFTPNNIESFVFTDLFTEAKNIIKLTQASRDKSILIVSNDEELILKIIFLFKINNIEASIIRDYPLQKSKTFLWLDLALNFIIERFSHLSFLALFKHPYSSLATNEIEKKLREKNSFINSVFQLKTEFPELEEIENAVSKFSFSGSFTNLLKQHIELAAKLAKQNIWEEEENVELEKFLKQLEENFSSKEYISISEYSSLFKHFIKSAYYRPQVKPSRIILAKPLDARLLNADLVIIAGLNHGIWPSSPKSEPFLNNYLYSKIGLPSGEEKQATEAFDFWCLSQADKVIYTRSERVNSSVALASSWLLRIKALSRNTIETIVKEESLNINQVKLNNPPSPCPPLNYRPAKLSATQIEKLIFNPYHIYVDSILKLKKLNPIKKELTALDFGNFIHRAIAIYGEQKISIEDAGKRALTELKMDLPLSKLLWWNRYLRIASWYVENENEDAKLLIETSGKLILANNFVITAIADRIEIINDKYINLIDYKTGRLPTLKSINTGKTLQLLIEAIMVLEGNFYALKNKKYIINLLKYIQLSGDENFVDFVEINQNIDELVSKTKEYLENLTLEYQNPLIPYHYSKKRVVGYCEYAHLARQ